MQPELHECTTERLLDSVRAVRHSLGSNYTEAVYHRALEVEFRCRGIPYESEVVATVVYRGHTVGSVRLDMVMGKTIIVELKAVKPGRVTDCHVEQLQKYMDLLGLREGVVVNFAGPDGVDYRIVSRD